MSDPIDDVTQASLRVTITALMDAVEQMDKGMKLVLDVLSQHDKRIRALELEMRKLTRKNLPVIVNQHGERAN
jgi:hypothetical protein